MGREKIDLETEGPEMVANLKQQETIGKPQENGGFPWDLMGNLVGGDWNMTFIVPD